jgi:hypothetical protein
MGPRGVAMRAEMKNLLAAIVIVCAAAAVWITYWKVTSESRMRIRCFGNLRTISAATFYWTTTHEGRTPPSLKELLGRAGISQKTFLCPASGSELTQGTFVCDYDSLFDRAGRPVPLLNLDDTSHTPMVWDRDAVHDDGEPYRFVLFADGSLRETREAEFAHAIKRLGRRAQPAEKKPEEESPHD